MPDSSPGPQEPPRVAARQAPDASTQASVREPGELGAALAQMAGVLLSSQTVDTAVGLVTTLAATTLAQTAGAGVSLMDEQGRRSTAPSGPLVEQADALQYQLDAGPCLSAWRDHRLVRVDDTQKDSRWPDWMAAALDLGVRSVLSVPLQTAGDTIGAIKVYSLQPGAYGPDAEHVLTLFARQAAILLANAQTTSQARQASADLAAAMKDRDVISRATGVLLARGAGDVPSAYRVLVTAAQSSRMPLLDVARQVTDAATGATGAFPPVRPRPERRDETSRREH